ARPGPSFWEHEGNRAVRDGSWKVLAADGGAWKLCDMSCDRAEMHDVAAARSDVVTTCRAMERMGERARVLPLEGWMDVDESATTLSLKRGGTVPAARSPILAGCGVSMFVQVTKG